AIRASDEGGLVPDGNSGVVSSRSFIPAPFPSIISQTPSVSQKQLRERNLSRARALCQATVRAFTFGGP
ncbi:MAG TPA: hypothetical protein VJT73_03040, partial [Polyangiaceae bacterium]|nr:hypothetical protein [Polyangiaceae bacterium]